MELIIIQTTTSSEKEAEKIGDILVQNRLAACVQILPGIRSIYTWKGELAHETETLISIKTDKKLESRVYQMLKDLHSYEVPEIITISAEGDKEYKKWCIDNINYNL